MKRAFAFAVSLLVDMVGFGVVAILLGILWLRVGWNNLLAHLPRPAYEWILAHQTPIFKKIAVWPGSADRAVNPKAFSIVRLFLWQCRALDITVSHCGMLKYQNVVCGNIFRGRSAKELVLRLWDDRADRYLRGCARYLEKSSLYRTILSVAEIRLVLRAPVEQITPPFVA